MATVKHLTDPAQDFSLCGDSDDGIFLDEVPELAVNGEEVTCPLCLRIIAHCVKYAAQQSVQATAATPRKTGKKSTGKVARKSRRA